MSKTKVCPACKEEKPAAKFGYRAPNAKGVRYLVSKCRQCKHKHEIEKGWFDPEADALKSRERYDTVYKVERKANINRARYILTDCRRDDKKRGHECDLDIAFIDSQIIYPCSYCSDPDPAKMTLDRVDNSRGHMKDNVVPACLPCNTARGAKPIGDWIGLCEAKGYKVTDRAYAAREKLAGATSSRTCIS